MQKLYHKSEIWFAVAWIIVYVVGTSITDGLSEAIGTAKSLTVVFHAALTAAALIWVKKSGLAQKYGLRRPKAASQYLWYVPLAFLSSVNLWFGVGLNMPVHETALYVGSMICVGFLEEFIFRGLLFKAMAKDGVTSAIAVSSLTFGIGHIVNLFNGSGAGTVDTLCQIAYAAAFGYMFVVIFHRGGSLVPCIVSHSVINSLSAFGNDAALTGRVNIAVSAVLCVVAVAYAAVLGRTLGKEQAE